MDSQHQPSSQQKPANGESICMAFEHTHGFCEVCLYDYLRAYKYTSPVHSKSLQMASISMVFEHMHGVRAYAWFFEVLPVLLFACIQTYQPNSLQKPGNGEHMRGVRAYAWFFEVIVSEFFVCIQTHQTISRM